MTKWEWPREYSELHSDDKFLFLADIKPVESRYKAAVLKLHIPKIGELDDDEQPPHPMAAQRYDFPTTFSSKTSALKEATSIAMRMSSGEFTLIKPEVKESLDKYRLTASALYRIDHNNWQATLEIVSKRPENKNAKQSFRKSASPLQSNHFPTSERAMAFAIQYGKELIKGATPGLKI